MRLEKEWGKKKEKELEKMEERKGEKESGEKEEGKEEKIMKTKEENKKEKRKLIMMVSDSLGGEKDGIGQGEDNCWRKKGTKKKRKKG